MGNRQGKKGPVPPEELGELIRIVMVGGSGVGKTALTMQFVQDYFPEEYDCTIEDRYDKTFNFDGLDVQLEIVDTAGEEEFTALRDVWIRESDLVVLVYSIDNKKSWDEATTSILQQIQRVKDWKHVSNNNRVMLVGNKRDLQDERQVTTEEAKEFVEKNGVGFMETTARSGEEVDEMFSALLRFAKDPNFCHQNVKRAR